MKEISLEEMLKCGVHFGHSVSRVYPKMKPFIFSERQGISIIDLEKTKEKLKAAQEFFQEIAKKNGTILFVGTKKQARPIIIKYAEKLNMPYIVERWVGGTFTNFEVIKKMVDKFKKLKEDREKGELDKYTKKERIKIDEEIARLEEDIGGIQNMTKLPDVVYIIDVKNQRAVIREAEKKKIPIVAIVDVNCNPKGIDYIIPANDDATKSIELITSALVEAFESSIKDKEGTKNKEGEK